MSSNGVHEAERDYGTGLVLFGILDVAAGVLYLAKTVVFVILSLSAIGALPARYGRGEIVVTALVALPAAVFFLALGFGSIAGRRWARSLSVAFSAVWLVVGSAAAAFLFVCLPRVFSTVRSLDTGSAALSGAARAYAAIAAFGVILPAAYFFFYRSAGVKSECERRDPDDRWTDRIPVTGLSVAIVLTIGALVDIGLAFSTSRQRLFFGASLGGSVRAAVVAASALQLFAAWGICRRDRRAWPVATGLMAIRAAVDAAIAARLGGTSLSALAANAGPMASNTRAVIERLEPLRPLTAVAGFFAALAFGAFLFTAWTWRRSVRGTG